MNYNFKVVVDAGHGGSDPGAVANNTREKDLTLAISEYMYNRFKELGVPVVLTRNTDETLNATSRVNRILNAFGNSPDVVVISNHINSSSTGTAEGAEVIYALRNDRTLAQNILDALGNAGQKKRTVFQKRLPSDSSKDYYFIHRNTGKTEPVIVEYGFINNSNDLNKLMNNYKKYVDAVVDAVIATKMGGSIPTGPSTVYTVKSGDSLYKIAQNYNTTVSAIKSANALTTNNLSIGQVLTIPSTNTNISSENENIYIVKRGDSLWTIANKFNTTVNELKRINNLTDNMLSIGQELLIKSDVPNIPMEAGIYVVQNGDSLWKIAQMYDTDINEIKKINNLTSDSLSIGQKLKVPNNTGSLPELVHTVQSGDTLWKISKIYNATVDDIKRLNNLTTNNLMIGQKLLIPTN